MLAQWKLDYYKEALLDIINEDLGIETDSLIFTNAKLDEATKSLINSIESESMASGDDVAASNLHAHWKNEIGELKKKSEKDLKESEDVSSRKYKEMQTYYQVQIENLQQEIRDLTEELNTK